MDGCLCAYVRAYVCVCMCLFMFVCVCLFVFVSRQAGRAHRVVVLPSGEARDGFNHARRIPLLTGTASQRRAKQATCEAQKGGKKSAHVCPPHLEGFFHAPKAACRQKAMQHRAKDIIRRRELPCRRAAIKHRALARVPHRPQKSPTSSPWVLHTRCTSCTSPAASGSSPLQVAAMPAAAYPGLECQGSMTTKKWCIFTAKTTQKVYFTAEPRSMSFCVCPVAR